VAESETLKIFIEAVTQGAVDEINNVVRAEGDLIRETQRTSVSFTELNQGISLIQRGFSAFKTAASALFGALDQAAKVEGLSRSFENLQSSIGSSATSKLERLKEATGGLASELELMQAANNAVILGIDDGTGKFEEATTAVIKLAQASGVDATEALKVLTEGVGRQSTEMLNNIGIIVKADEAYKGLDKNATQAAKTQAFAATAFQQAIDKAKNLPDVLESGATAAIKVTKSFENLRNEFVKNLSSNQNLARELNKLSDIIDDIDTKQLAREIGDIGAAATEATSRVLKFVDSIAKISQSLTNQGVSQNVGGALLSAAKKNPIFGPIIIAAEAAENKVNEFAKGLGVIVDESYNAVGALGNISGEGGSAFGGGGGGFNGVSDAAKKAADEVKAFKQTIDEAANSASLDAIKNALDIKIDSGTRTGFNELLEEFRRVSADGIRLGLSEGLRDSELADQHIAIVNNPIVEDYKQQMADAAEENAAKEAEARKAQIIETINFWKGVADEVVDGVVAIKEILGASFSFDFQPGQSNELITALKERKTEADKIKQTGNQIAVTAGNVAGAFFGVPFAGTFASEFKQALGLDKIDPFNLTVDALFSKKNAGANARENFKKFFNEIISDLDLNFIDFFEIPGGRHAFDPIVDEFGNATTQIDQKLSQLQIPQELMESFLGLGNAFDAAFDFEDLDGLAGQFGQILALNLQNVQGLNDFQLLLQSAGISAEELKQGLENAFLTGDLAAADFLFSTAQINELFTQGIPNAIGATDIAFQNFIEGGLSSGREAYDALGDVGAEAIEKLGDEASFEDLQNLLLEQGASVDEVTKFFEVLAQVGIGSIEDLKNVTVIQTAQIIDELNKLNFGFVDPIEKVEELTQTLEQIPEKLVTDYEIRVRVTGDPIPSEVDQGLGRIAA